jgi:SAP domain-containing new25
MPKNRLSPAMTLAQFENGYWYADELKNFARTLSIANAAKLRKDELEKAIKHFLATGKIKAPTKRSLVKTGETDIEKGLSLNLAVVNYTSNKTTKDFLVSEALKIAPGLKKKSGARYRLNRWREEQLTAGKKITYRDLVKKYVELNSGDERFAQIPSGRYINFLSDYLAAEKGASKEDAIGAWKKLKKLDIPKNYKSWKKSKAAKR